MIEWPKPTQRRRNVKDQRQEAKKKNGLDEKLMPAAADEVIGAAAFPPRKKPEKQRSLIWICFALTLDGKSVRSISGCKTTFTYAPATGTSHIRRHMKTCKLGCRKARVEASQVLADDDDDADEGEHGNDTRHLSQTTLCFAKKEGHLLAVPDAATFTQKRGRVAKVEMVAMDDNSFLSVENEGFKFYSAILRPEFEVVGRRTVQRDVLKNYEESKLFIKKLLCDSRNCMKNITTDLWSSRAADGYMGGTMHFTSHDGRLFHFLLMFEAIPQPHNAPTISNELFSLMLEWGIIDDFLCCVLDNASVNDSAMTILRGARERRNTVESKPEPPCIGDIDHGRCVGHIFNLVAKACLEILAVMLEKLRNNVSLIRRKPKQKAAFVAILESTVEFRA